jgi:hypothetical protein
VPQKGHPGKNRAYQRTLSGKGKGFYGGILPHSAAKTITRRFYGYAKTSGVLLKVFIYIILVILPEVFLLSLINIIFKH